MRRPGLSLPAVFVMATTAGCSIAGPAAHRGTPNVWVGSDETAAIMVQITRSGDTLSGTLDETGLDSPDAVGAKPVHAAFTGTADRTGITLTFPEGLGFSTSLAGTLTDKQMSLAVPQDNGAVATVTLRPGSVDQYNRLVAGVHGHASANASASQAAAVAAAEGAAEDEARQRVGAAATAVAKDVTALRSAADDTPDFGGFTDTIASARENLAAAKKDAKKAATDDSSEACSDAYAAQSDAYSVESDSYSIDSDIDSLGTDTDAVDSAIGDLNHDLDAYHAAAEDAPGYRPPGAPDEQSIRATIETARTTAKGWKSRGAAYRSTVARLLTEATKIADAAVKRYC